MRLWHKDLLSVLPRQQLLGQWRECCAIAKNIAEKGTPNHVLVNKIMDYPLSHFVHYGLLVEKEMENHGYNCLFQRFSKWFEHPSLIPTEFDYDELFKNWHDYRYLLQCYYNLQEKYDCKAITEEEWKKIDNHMVQVIWRIRE